MTCQPVAAVTRGDGTHQPALISDPLNIYTNEKKRLCEKIMLLVLHKEVRVHVYAEYIF